MRGRRPCSASNATTASRTREISLSSSQASPALPVNVAEYAPCTTAVSGTCRPQASSSAELISPSEARARAASTLSASRFCGWSPADVLSVLAADARSASRHALTRASSREARSFSRRATCDSRTASLSMFRMFRSSGSSRTYLFTPTTVSCNESMRACFFVAASSILSLAMPLSMYLVMPPEASISSISFIAPSQSSSVRLSMR
mmetsp:Transcript_13829/g.41041  ORF Transcript_13829/g.41041 Transcript_13829/m.41041 type:complete len:205 (-) Transcript_13829:1371-1985(-)